MKRIVQLIAACALATATMMAQPFGRAAGGPPPDPATMAQHQVERLTALLSLTTNQVSQATTIFTNAATAAAALQTTQKTDRDALQTAVKNNATATIDQLAASLGTISGQVLSIQSKADAAFYAILTPDQKTKLDQSGGFGRGGFGGPGGPGGRGPGGPPPGRN